MVWIIPTVSLPQRVYTVRLRQSDSTAHTTWRVSVQNSGIEERHILVTLEEFFAFVERADARYTSHL